MELLSVLNCIEVQKCLIDTSVNANEETNGPQSLELSSVRSNDQDIRTIADDFISIWNFNPTRVHRHQCSACRTTKWTDFLQGVQKNNGIFKNDYQKFCFSLFFFWKRKLQVFVEHPVVQNVVNWHSAVLTDSYHYQSLSIPEYGFFYKVFFVVLFFLRSGHLLIGRLKEKQRGLCIKSRSASTDHQTYLRAFYHSSENGFPRATLKIRRSMAQFWILFFIWPRSDIVEVVNFQYLSCVGQIPHVKLVKYPATFRDSHEV